MDKRVKENEEKEILEALNYVKEYKSFVFEGGAGCGKTYSLISLIRKILHYSPQKRIICITYTNNAVAELNNRIHHNNLEVHTIHEFIWGIIKRYQREIKIALVEAINNPKESSFPNPQQTEAKPFDISYLNNVKVIYDDYYSMKINDKKEVKISHYHIIYIAEKIFSKYKKLCDIFKDIAECLFIDEYQDTDKKIIKILLEHLTKSNKKNVIGFFGDSMQAIYNDGIGSLSEYNLEKIINTQNRRNPKIIIDIANKFRRDQIQQVPSTDPDAPNMQNGKVIEGNFKFIYGDTINDLDDIRNSSLFVNLGFNTSSHETKELHLTHRNIAETAGFKKLYKLYNTSKWRDSITSYKFNNRSNQYESTSSRDPILKRLDILYKIIELYELKQTHKLLKIINFEIIYKNDLVALQEHINYIRNNNHHNIVEILDYATKNKLLENDDLFNNFIIEDGSALWNSMHSIPFKEYQESMYYLKEYSPYSTQHKVKGSEFKDILLILDSNWPKYDFNTLFIKGRQKNKIIEDTANLFYVCITRAKRNLIIFMPTRDYNIINKAMELFGKENVIAAKDLKEKS